MWLVFKVHSFGLANVCDTNWPSIRGGPLDWWGITIFFVSSYLYKVLKIPVVIYFYQFIPRYFSFLHKSVLFFKFLHFFFSYIYIVHCGIYSFHFKVRPNQIKYVLSLTWQTQICRPNLIYFLPLTLVNNYILLCKVGKINENIFIHGQLSPPW